MSDLPATLSGGGFDAVEARSFYDAPIRIFVQSILSSPSPMKSNSTDRWKNRISDHSRVVADKSPDSGSVTVRPRPESLDFDPPLHPAKRHEARRRTQPARPNTLSRCAW